MLLLVGLSITVGAKDYVSTKRQSVAYTDSTTTDTYTISSVKYPVLSLSPVLSIFGRHLKRLVRSISTIFLKTYKFKWEESINKTINNNK